MLGIVLEVKKYAYYETRTADRIYRRFGGGSDKDNVLTGCLITEISTFSITLSWYIVSYVSEGLVRFW